MTRVLVLALLLASCQKNDSEGTKAVPSAKAHPGAGPTAPPQSAEELKAPLAKIDDVTITIGEFEERIN
ncbi:MAG TPA: hypothetical protein VGM88_34745, partial [Kofleriaceae bacterium]